METVRTYDYVRIKLVVRNGVFEAHRNAEKKETMEYNQKSYTSGKKMAELIRKGAPQ